MRGAIRLRAHEPDRAIEDFARAIQLNPNDGLAYNNRGVAYQSQAASQTDAQQRAATLSRAIDDYEQAARLDPENAAIHYNLGLVYAETPELAAPTVPPTAKSRTVAKPFHRALDEFTEAIRLNPNDADFYHNRGRLYGQLGDEVKSRADLSLAQHLRAALSNE